MKKMKLTKKLLNENVMVKGDVKVNLLVDGTMSVHQNYVEVMNTLKLSDITDKFGQSGWSIAETSEEYTVVDDLSEIEHIELEDGSVVKVDELPETDEDELPAYFYEEEVDTNSETEEVISVDVVNKIITTNQGEYKCDSKSHMFQIMAEDFKMTAGQIAKMCDAHYSFVFGVLKRLNLAGSGSTIERPKTETKSSKMIELFEQGMKCSQIAKELNAHPSHVYAVIGKYKKSNL